ncbi:MAG: hypothetical protein OER82_05395 [Nitrosopumilus sp.]|nr:hypothetical protein [Nitrosopumilus sp.]
MSEIEISVEVQPEFPSDKGKGIARLDTDSMKRLELISGDIIEIQGQRKTYSKCLASPKENHAHGILKIDGLIRSNAGISIGNRIYIKKIMATRAKKITIAPLEIMPFIEESEIKEALTLFPIIKDDNVVFENLGKHVFFRILESIPPNSALITTSETDFQIKEYYFLKKDKKLEEGSKNLKQSYTDDEFTEEVFLQIKTNFES